MGEHAMEQHPDTRVGTSVDLSDLLAELESGSLSRRAGAALQQLASDVLAYGNKGKMTLEVTLSPVSDAPMVQAAWKLSVKPPNDGDGTVYRVTDHGLQDQGTLFPT